MVPVGILELCLSSYSHPNISDGNFSLVPHFIFVQVFQIYLWGQSGHIKDFPFYFKAHETKICTSNQGGVEPS